MTPESLGPIPCAHCDVPLVYVPVAGWQHEGGGLVMLRCRCCSHRWAPTPGEPSWCPECGSADVVDDHVASPDRSRGVA